MASIWHKWVAFRDSRRWLNVIITVLTNLFFIAALIVSSFALGHKEGAREAYDVTLPSVVEFVNNACGANLHYDPVSGTLFEKLGEKRANPLFFNFSTIQVDNP